MANFTRINVTSSPSIMMTSRLTVPAGARVKISSAVASVLSGAGSNGLFYVESGGSLTLDSLILVDGAVDTGACSAPAAPP